MPYKNINYILNKTYFNNSKIQIINNINPVEKRKLGKIVGEAKHFVPANKEWKNSIYCYNSDKSLLSKHKLLNKFLTSYFTFESFFNLKNKLKYFKSHDRFISKKMLKNRKSINQILLSKPEIKETNDKIIVTMYTYNRRKEHLIKKIYLSNKYLDQKNIIKFISTPKSYFLLNSYSKKKDKQLLKINNNYLYNQNDNTLYNTYKKNMISKYMNSIIMAKLKKISLIKLTNIMKNKYRYKSKYKNKYKNRYKKSIMFNKLDSKFKNYLNKISLYKKKFIITLIKKKLYLKTIFFFSFLRWILSSIKIEIYLKKKRGKKLLVIKSENIKVFFFRKNLLFIDNLKNINNMLFNIIIVSLNNQNLNKIYSSFIFFKREYFENFVTKYLKKDRFILENLYMLSFNNFKFNKFISPLKIIINKIYNKKILFNIVNLKQLYLNNDILVKSIALKLKRKKAKLLKTLKKSILLAKLPNKNSSLKDSPDNILLHNYTNNKLNSLDYNLDDKGKDTINQSLYNIFKFNSLYFKDYKKNINDENDRINILNSINYKWIKGIKIEGKGRLTKRFTASKSVYKYRYRGDLKNINKNLSQAMLRGDLKSNLQYGFITSKRRIGAFGIKGWISTV